MPHIIFTTLLLLTVPLAAFAGPYDVPAKIPDTGQKKCYDTAGDEIPCTGTGQDGEHVINGMFYTSLGGGTMVQDNVTGLIWEVKTNKDNEPNYNDPHDADNEYAWYDPNPLTNGGDAGKDSEHDTTDFINALNDANFGGYSDWRLPSVKELFSIVDYGLPLSGPTIDVSFFPNTVSALYWSSTTHPAYSVSVWVLHFGSGWYWDDFKYHGGLNTRYVRAVRCGQ